MDIGIFTNMNHSEILLPVRQELKKVASIFFCLFCFNRDVRNGWAMWQKGWDKTQTSQHFHSLQDSGQNYTPPFSAFSTSKTLLSSLLVSNAHTYLSLLPISFTLKSLPFKKFRNSHSKFLELSLVPNMSQKLFSWYQKLNPLTPEITTLSPKP